jgi:hydrogenase maturation protease
VGDGAVLVGLGARDRGDDAAGLIVAARLRPRLGGRVRVVEGCADALMLVAELDGAATAVVVDALRTADAAPGTLSRVDLRAGAPPRPPARVSGHGDALGTGWRLARALGAVPRRWLLVGVVGADFTLGAPLSAPVRAALEPLAAAAAAALDGSTA